MTRASDAPLSLASGRQIRPRGRLGASYLTGLGVRIGWYAYAPLSGQLQAPGIGEPGWLRLLIWLAAVSLWSLTSLRVLSQSPGPARLRDRP
jgi:hypothetical protein